MSFIMGHEWDGKRKFWQMLERSHTSFLTADTRGTDCTCLQYRGDRITERQFFSSWFTSFSCILTTPCVGYHACKSIESVVYCLNNIPQIFPPPLCIERFHSRDQYLCKFIGTKESVCIRKEFNSHGTGLGHQHGHRFIVLGNQYGRCDVMWKHSIMTL